VALLSQPEDLTCIEGIRTTGLHRCIVGSNSTWPTEPSFRFPGVVDMRLVKFRTKAWYLTPKTGLLLDLLIYPGACKYKNNAMHTDSVKYRYLAKSVNQHFSVWLQKGSWGEYSSIDSSMIVFLSGSCSIYILSEIKGMYRVQSHVISQH
jgi:hypothetical protein